MVPFRMHKSKGMEMFGLRRVVVSFKFHQTMSKIVTTPLRALEDIVKVENPPS